MVPSYRVCSAALAERAGGIREGCSGIESPPGTRHQHASPARKSPAPLPHRRKGAGPGRTGSGEPDTRIRCLANVEQVHHENQGLAGLNNRACTAVTVGHVGGNLQATTAANLHAEQTLIPAADNLANANLER